MLQNSRENPPRVILSISLVSIGLLAYSVTRAFTLSMTPDEISTLIFAKGFIVYPDTYHNMSANHHWLNSWLMFLSRSVFGENEFAFRLPNLLAHAAYLFFTARLALSLRKGFFSVGAFLLLNAHPYLLDFFSLARGYGLSFAGLSAALYFLYRFTESRKTGFLAGSLLGGTCAALANFTLLNVFLPLCGVLLFLAWQPAFSDKLKRGAALVQSGVLLLFAGGLLALVLPHLFNLHEAGALHAGLPELWGGTVKTLCRQILYEAPYTGKDAFRSSVPAIIVMCVLIVIAVLYTLLRKKWNDASQRFAVMMFLLFSGTILLVWLQHELTGTVYPYTRTGLYLFVLFLATFVAAVAALPVPPGVQGIFTLLLALPVTFHLFYTANTVYVIEWRGCGNNDRFAKRIIGEYKKHGDPKLNVAITADVESWSTMHWVKEKYAMPWLQITEGWGYEPLKPGDFYILTKQMAPFKPTKGWKMIDTCTISGNALYVDTTSVFYTR